MRGTVASLRRLNNLSHMCVGLSLPPGAALGQGPGSSRWVSLWG
jgi:hypothetical protein